MTFVTPTLLAGDRSLTNVIAHEIAHSWTGGAQGEGGGASKYGFPYVSRWKGVWEPLVNAQIPCASCPPVSLLPPASHGRPLPLLPSSSLSWDLSPPRTHGPSRAKRGCFSAHHQPFPHLL